MAEREHGGGGYLLTIGQELLPEIDVFWTGPEIISQEITVAHVQELQTVLRRKPLIWGLELLPTNPPGRRASSSPERLRWGSVRRVQPPSSTTPLIILTP